MKASDKYEIDVEGLCSPRMKSRSLLLIVADVIIPKAVHQRNSSLVNEYFESLSRIEVAERGPVALNCTGSTEFQCKHDGLSNRQPGPSISPRRMYNYVQARHFFVYRGE